MPPLEAPLVAKLNDDFSRGISRRFRLGTTLSDWDPNLSEHPSLGIRILREELCNKLTVYRVEKYKADRRKSDIEFESLQFRYDLPPTHL